MHKTTMTTSRPVRLFTIAAILVFVPGIAHALGLGKLTVYTALNEPLKAEIRFTSLTEKEFRTLDARLITQPYNLSGSSLESTMPFLGIGITLVEREPKAYALLFQTDQPMREPFLRLILEIEWAGGRLVREFTTLIDPRELRAPSDEDMPEFPSLTKVGDLGRQDSETRSLTDIARNSIPRNEQAEVLTEKNVGVAQPEVSNTQEPIDVTVKSQPDVVASSVSESTQPAPSTQDQIATQRRLIQAEIENWAKQRGLSVDKEPRKVIVSDSDVEVLPDNDVGTEMPEIIADRSMPEEAPQAAPVTPQTANDGLLGRDFLMVLIGLAVAVVLVVGFVTIRIYIRQRRAMEEHAQHAYESDDEDRAEIESQIEYASDDDVEDLPDYGDRRSGSARRQQFVSVQVDRRQGARRQRDRFSQTADHVDTVRASTMDESEVYMACGHDENAELLLKEALAKNPDRKDLKVKLLAIYQQRGDPEAFDVLAGELYSDVNTKKATNDRSSDVTQKPATQAPSNENAGDITDFDHSMDSAMLHGDSNGSNNDQDSDLLDADIFEREVEALAMSIPTEDDAEESESVPADENLNNAIMEGLKVKDFAEIKQAVDRGVGLLESNKGVDQDYTDSPESADTATDKPPKKTSKSNKVSAEERQKPDDKSSSQWKEPSTKIDLAKAYIAMGDAERARSILDEVLEEWSSRDGTQG